MLEVEVELKAEVKAEVLVQAEAKAESMSAAPTGGLVAHAHSATHTSAPPKHASTSSTPTASCTPGRANHHSRPVLVLLTATRAVDGGAGASGDRGAKEFASTGTARGESACGGCESVGVAASVSVGVAARVSDTPRVVSSSATAFIVCPMAPAALTPNDSSG